MLSLPLVSPFPLGPSLGQGSLLRPGGRLSRLLHPGGRLSRLLRPGGRLSRLLRRRAPVTSAPPWWASVSSAPPWWAPDLPEPPPLTCQSHLTPPLTCQSHLTPPLTCQSHLTPPLTCQSHLTSQRSTQYPFTSLLSHWPHMDLALRPLPRFHLRSTALLEYALCKRLEAALRGGGSVMNLVTTHYNCTSPMDYISHHALHTHIPVHHYTNHTAVTIHSLVLIASPHLHLILTLTFKQHSHLHSLRSLVLPWLTFPSIFPCVYYLDR